MKSNKTQLSITLETEKLLGVCTKRGLLSAVASIFDPRLFVANYHPRKTAVPNGLPGKKTWDQHLKSSYLQTCDDIASDWLKKPNFPFPRCIYDPLSKTSQLLCFYATNIYLCWEGASASCNLLFSKSRLNPVKKLYIPTLELLVVFIGVKALELVKNQLGIPIDQTVI